MGKLLALLYVCIIISFINAYGYGLYDVILAAWGYKFRIKLAKYPVRHVNRIYLLVPAMNESHVIVRCADCLFSAARKTQSVWPRLSCKLVFIDDASTDGTSAKLDRISRKHPTLVHVIHRRQPNAQNGKGMALNNALRWIDKQHSDSNRTVIGVIDSDSTPRTDFLLSLIPIFEYTHYNLIQASILINNVSSFLTVMQRFEFGVPNFLAQLFRTRLGSALACGNGQFMMLKMADQVRWRKSLLDDLEFSINGLLRGFYGIFLPTVEIPQEGVINYVKLIRQRVRWCQGGMQCLNKYTRPLLHDSYIKMRYKIDLILEMSAPFFAMIFDPCSLVSFILIIYYLIVSPLETIAPIVLILLVNFMITSTMILSVKHLSGQSFHSVTDGHFFKIIMGNLIYLWLLAPVPYIALFRFLTHHNSWMKTSH